MTYELVKSYTAHLNASYVGKAQEAIFSFSLAPEQLDFINRFFENMYVSACMNAVTDESPGDELLILNVYRDTVPTWRTDYQVQITATDRTGNMLPWGLIILATLVLVAYWFVVRPLLIQVTDLIYGPPSGGRGGRGSVLVGPIPWIVLGIGVVLLGPSLVQKRKETSNASKR